ncbi:MAG: hypothetical protein A2W03_11140 [Candidatus Aminicenantes bacterium RBG_16_63_16]|nr:MAG: hypothetical protein A2W03_11140 [Candidatus Aminicenantes bacterium RBG_16_63_16]
MLSTAVYPLLLILSLLSQTTRAIERAFFEDRPALLYTLLTDRGHVNLTFPEPISFSDQVSSEQAFFVFRRLHRTFSTFEFYADAEFPILARDKGFIFKARWSFRNRANNDQYVFQVFFYLSADSRPQGDGRPLWKITDIRAERL